MRERRIKCLRYLDVLEADDIVTSLNLEVGKPVFGWRVRLNHAGSSKPWLFVQRIGDRYFTTNPMTMVHGEIEDFDVTALDVWAKSLDYVIDENLLDETEGKSMSMDDARLTAEMWRSFEVRHPLGMFDHVRYARWSVLDGCWKGLNENREVVLSIPNDIRMTRVIRAQGMEIPVPLKPPVCDWLGAGATS